MFYIRELNSLVLLLCKICMIYSLVTGFAAHSDSYHKELELLIGTESELYCLTTTFVTSAILSADHFRLMSNISSDGHFSEVYVTV